MAQPSSCRNPASPKSPSSPKRVSDSRVALQLQQFFDDWHYRVMHSSLGKTWTRTKVLVTALELLVLNGVPLTQQDIAWMSQNDEAIMIPELVKKMPFGVRENFEAIAQQLLMFALTATRVRIAVDSRNEESIAQIMEETDTGAIKEQILKEAVIQASKEVADVLRCQDTWIKNTERRLDRLTHSAEMAQRAEDQLKKVEMQLEGFHATNKDRSKKALMNFVQVGSKNVLHSAFTNWFGVAVKGRGERELRTRFEKELEEKEMKLMQLKSKAMANVTNAMMRKAREGDGDLLGAFFRGWVGEVGSTKKEVQEAAELKELQGKLAQFASEKAANAKKVMARLGADQEGALLVMVFQAWLQGASELKGEKKFEEQVKAAEEQVKAFLLKKKEDCKAMFEKMGTATDSGLLHSALQGWAKAAEEEKQTRAMEAAITGAEDKFKSLRSRQKDNAFKVQTRVTDQVKSNVLLRVLSAWQLESKINHIEKYYGAKMDGKRKQLQSVQTLFKSFAKQLDEGLGNIDGDSSGRTQTRRTRSMAGMTRAEGSVSLPDIHARPA